MTKQPQFMNYAPGLPMPPTRPRDQHLRIVRHRNTGSVFLEKRNDKLFVNGLPVFLFQHNQQTMALGTNASSVITGIEIENEILNARISGAETIDALLEEPELFPDQWKVSSKPDNVMFVFALGTIYGGLNTELYQPQVIEHARGLYFENGKLHEVTHLLNSPWFEDVHILMVHDDIV